MRVLWNLLGAAEAEMLRRGAEAGRDRPDVEASMDQPIAFLVEGQNELKRPNFEFVFEIVTKLKILV